MVGFVVEPVVDNCFVLLVVAAAAATDIEVAMIYFYMAD